MPRLGESDKLLLNADRNPNSTGARLIGVAADNMGANLPKIAEGIRQGKITTLLVFGEDVTKHGIAPDLLQKLDLLVVCDILPTATTRAAHYLLPGCAHAGETRNIHQLQRACPAVHESDRAAAATLVPSGSFLARIVSSLIAPEPYANIEGLFNQMTQEVPAFAGLKWADLGDPE